MQHSTFQTPALPLPRRILRLREVESRTGFKRSHIYNLMKEDRFPRAVKLGARAVGWDSIAVDSWVTDRLTSLDTPAHTLH
ncbi:MAG: transcriptional regulator [Pseudomonas sp. PGPPP3]|nr:MAG: transcriptional regulator [Pseudomonas sp. PGPPP3]